MTRAELKFRLAGRLGATLLRALGATWRVRVEDDGPFREMRRARHPVIFTFWHSRILPLAYFHRDEGNVALVSQHGDGEYTAQILERMGYGATARGSATRGGVQGLRGLIRAVREGHDLGFTPDGPRGPARELKDGVLVTAQLSGAAILPLAAGGPSVWSVGSWDRMVIPKPFSRVTLKYGALQFVPRDATEADLVEHNARLTAELNRITDAVDGEPAT
jgi:lysophospholipid acyltransferase (LPLAT)-like uncharacterized protein